MTMTLKQMREAVFLSQKVVAAKLHVTISTISNWERGVKAPRLSHIRQLVELYEVDIAALRAAISLGISGVAYLEQTQTTDAAPYVMQSQMIAETTSRYHAAKAPIKNSADNLKIFVSHAHQDLRFCHLLTRQLREKIADVDVYFDTNELRGGDDWARHVQREIINRPICIVVLSPHSVHSTWVREEINLALGLQIREPSRRRIIPVLSEACAIEVLSPLLLMRNVIDLCDPSLEKSWDDLLHSLSNDKPPKQPLNPIDEIGKAAEMERARSYAMQTHDAILKQQWRHAIRLGSFALSLGDNARDATLLGDLGLASIVSGQIDEGIRYIDQALQVNEFRSDLWRVKARALFQEVHPVEAAHAWNMALLVTQSVDGKLAILREYTDALIDLQAWDAALSMIDEALEIASDDISWNTSKVYILEQAGRVDEASDLAKKVAQQMGKGSRRPPPPPPTQFAIPCELAELTFVGMSYQNVAAIIPPLREIAPKPGSDSAATASYPSAITPFAVGTYPVTVAEYACAVRARVVPEPDECACLDWQAQLLQPTAPVVCVPWQAAKDYAAWLARITHEAWRLPTEAEWALAAQGYPQPSAITPSADLSCAGACAARERIGQHPAVCSAYGLQDIAAIPGEWCWKNIPEANSDKKKVDDSAPAAPDHRVCGVARLAATDEGDSPTESSLHASCSVGIRLAKSLDQPIKR